MLIAKQIFRGSMWRELVHFGPVDRLLPDAVELVEPARALALLSESEASPLEERDSLIDVGEVMR